MASVRREVQMSFRPRPMQVPRACHWTDNVVAPLHNYTRNMPDLSNVLNEEIFRWKETVVHEVVTLDACKGQRKLRIREAFNRLRIEEKFRSAAFPDAPRARRGDLLFFIVAGK